MKSGFWVYVVGFMLAPVIIPVLVLRYLLGR